MLKTIERQQCLSKYSKLPLRVYNKKKDQETFNYPEVHTSYWMKLHANTTIQLKKSIAAEMTKLFGELNVKRLIFLCDVDATWITANSKDRTDYAQLTKAIAYLRNNELGFGFNGAAEVDIFSLQEFLQHFYILTRCDGSFCYYHFVDENENYIGYIHYDGEVKIDTLNEKSDSDFSNAVKRTKFVDAFRKDTGRI